jgi:hypothetical protein
VDEGSSDSAVVGKEIEINYFVFSFPLSLFFFYLNFHKETRTYVFYELLKCRHLAVCNDKGVEK